MRAATLALVAAMAVSSVAVGRAAPPAASEAEAALDAFHAALAGGDRDRALSALASDVVIFEGGGAELSREEYAHHHLAGDMAYLAATTTERIDRRSAASGDVVWILTRSRTTGTFRDQPVATVGTETALLSRTADGWKIVHLHWSSRTAPK